MINLKLSDIKEQLPKEIIDEFCKQAFENVNLYPQDYDKLIQKLAVKHSVKPENIVLTNGADEAIELITRVFGQNILFFSPTYYEFADAPSRNNLKFQEINCFDGKNYLLKYKDSDLQNKSLVFLCNPNNPFGKITKNEMLLIARKTKAIVAVDETYIDFGGKSVINEFEKQKNILVIRSFSKSYSLAGLRIGYLVGEKGLIDKISRIKLFCNVNSVAVNAASIVLDKESYFKSLIKQITARKNKFELFLKKNAFNVMKNDITKIIIKFNSFEKASSFCNFLATNEILVTLSNGFGTYGLDNSFVQFACGTENQMKQVTEIITKYIKECK